MELYRVFDSHFDVPRLLREFHRFTLNVSYSINKDSMHLTKFIPIPLDAPEPLLSYTQEILLNLPSRPIAARYLKLEPGEGYAFHKDPDVRASIALESNDDAVIRFKNRGSYQQFHLPCDGRIYFINPDVDHAVYNGGTQDRIHLVSQFDDLPKDFFSQRS